MGWAINKLLRFFRLGCARNAVTASQPTTQLSDYFLNLSYKSQYDVAAAIRGCDVSFEDCGSGSFVIAGKYYITERIRAIVFIRDLGSSGAYETGPLTEDNVLELASAVLPNTSIRHWLSHLLDAVVATQDHEIWGGHTANLNLQAVLENALRKDFVANQP